jgi:IclR family pca regulon transcriptional regulator
MQASLAPASRRTALQSAPARPKATHADAQQDLDAFAGDRSFVMSFARGVSVIQAFAHVSRPLTIAEVTHRTHIPRAAVRRLLHTLCELGYVKLVGVRYELTPKTLELGNAFASSNNIAMNAQPIVSRLAEQLRSFCALLVPENDETMLMCLAGTVPATVAVSRRMAPAPGNKAPLYASASGLLFLAGMTEDQLDAYFLRVSMLPFTFRTQTESKLVRESLRRVRSQGYAVCDRTFSDDLRSIAVPVHNACGALVGAIAAVVVAERLTEHELLSTLLPALVSAAREAGQRWT